MSNSVTLLSRLSSFSATQFCSFLPFAFADLGDILFFLDDIYQNTFDSLAAEIATEVEYYLEYNCAG